MLVDKEKKFLVGKIFQTGLDIMRISPAEKKSGGETTVMLTGLFFPPTRLTYYKFEPDPLKNEVLEYQDDKGCIIIEKIVGSRNIGWDILPNSFYLRDLKSIYEKLVFIYHRKALKNGLITIQ